MLVPRIDENTYPVLNLFKKKAYLFHHQEIKLGHVAVINPFVHLAGGGAGLIRRTGALCLLSGTIRPLTYGITSGLNTIAHGDHKCGPSHVLVCLGGCGSCCETNLKSCRVCLFVFTSNLLWWCWLGWWVWLMNWSKTEARNSTVMLFGRKREQFHYWALICAPSGPPREDSQQFACQPDETSKHSNIML